MQEEIQTPKIYLLDVTNRDVVQTAKLGLSKPEKTLKNIYLGEMGIFFENKEEANEMLELTRYANLEVQEPLVED